MSHLKALLFDALFFSVGLLVSFFLAEYLKDTFDFNEDNRLGALWALGVVIGIARTRLVNAFFGVDSDGK